MEVIWVFLLARVRCLAAECYNYNDTSVPLNANCVGSSELNLKHDWLIWYDL